VLIANHDEKVLLETLLQMLQLIIYRFFTLSLFHWMPLQLEMLQSAVRWSSSGMGRDNMFDPAKPDKRQHEDVQWQNIEE
jgi:hypothetical protein